MRRSGFLAFLVLVGLISPSYSWVDKSAFQAEATEVPGLADTNNVQFAFGRFIITAPYAPTTPITTDTSLADLDNKWLYVFDAKRVNSEPSKYDLGDCYYPTRVFFDEESSNVFIRCTQVIEKANGDLETRAVIKYLHLNLGENGKPLFGSSAQIIPIPGVGTEFADDAPNDLLIDKDIFLFTNGASIFTFSLLKGIIYRVDFISPKDFDLYQNAITYFGLDKNSDTVTIVTNKKEQSEDQTWKHSSELYFYKVNSDGTIDQLNRVKPDSFPEGVSLPAGSHVAINWDGELKDEGFAYFVGSDGNLYQATWYKGNEVFGSLERLASFEALRQENGENLSSVNTYFNKDSKTFEILKNGFTSYIHRPLNGSGGGRIGKIHRPLNLRLSVGTSAFALAQVGKKNKVVNQTVFTDAFADQGGLLNLFSDDQGNRYLSTYSGNIYELRNAQEVNSASVNLLGRLGERLGSVTYFAAREDFVATNSLEADASGDAILAPGSLLLAKRTVANNLLGFLNWLPQRSPFAQPLAFGIGSIRRPCNLGLH